MPTFQSEGFTLAYDIYGEGRPILAVHGFASSGTVNWVATGWVETLNKAGYQVITIDNRGHGAADKPHDPALYAASAMARDAANLITHLGHEEVALIGYSMGARICAHVCIQNPELVACAVLGGVGVNMQNLRPDAAEIIEGLNANSLSEVTHPSARQFRVFAEHTKSDLKALAACMTGLRSAISEEAIKRISVPVLVAVGSEDDVAGDPHLLADMLPNGEGLVIDRRDHMRATGDPQFKRGAIEFLSRVYPA